jgi:hypothetical protein
MNEYFERQMVAAAVLDVKRGQQQRVRIEEWRDRR